MKTLSSFRVLRTQELSAESMEGFKGGVHPAVAVGVGAAAGVGVTVAAAAVAATAAVAGIYYSIKYMAIVASSK